MVVVVVVALDDKVRCHLARRRSGSTDFMRRQKDVGDPENEILLFSLRLSRSVSRSGAITVISLALFLFAPNAEVLILRGR